MTLVRSQSGKMNPLIGMVTDRDIVCRCVAEGSDPTKATARQVMSKGIVFCRDEEELDDAARIMEHKKYIPRLPVCMNKTRG